MEAQLGIVWKARAIEEIVQAPTRGKSSFLIQGRRGHATSTLFFHMAILSDFLDVGARFLDLFALTGYSA
jgi:hypothetical protein